MFIESTALATIVLAVSIFAQQVPLDHTYFTNPVGDDHIYTAGDNTTFSWELKCVPPNTYVSANPTQVPVQLVNSTNSNLAYFLDDVTTIDCTKDKGNNNWIVSDKYADGTSLFSLKIVFDGGNAAYSGRFTIKPKASPSGPTPTTPSHSPNSAGAIAPVLVGINVVAVAGAVIALF